MVSYIVETERYGDGQYAMRITVRNSGNAMAENVRMLFQDMPPLSLASARGEGGISLHDVRTCYEKETLANAEYKGSSELCLTLAEMPGGGKALLYFASAERFDPDSMETTVSVEGEAVEVDQVLVWRG